MDRADRSGAVGVAAVAARATLALIASGAGLIGLAGAARADYTNGMSVQEQRFYDYGPGGANGTPKGTSILDSANPMDLMNKIRKGDKVVVTTGRDKGRQGTVIRVQADDKLLVENVNMVKKHQKPTNKDQKGGISDPTSREKPESIQLPAIPPVDTGKAEPRSHRKSLYQPHPLKPYGLLFRSHPIRHSRKSGRKSICSQAQVRFQ